MTAVDALQRKIDRLNRNIKITADSRVKETREGSGASAAAPPVAVALTPAKVKQYAASAETIAAATQETEKAQKGIDGLLKKRGRILDNLTAQKAEQADLVKKQAKNIRDVATVEAEIDERRKTAARNRLFGGNFSKAGNKLSPAQSQSIAEDAIQRQGRAIGQLNTKIEGTTRAYEEVTKAVRQLDGAERRRAMNAVDGFERADRKLEKYEKRQRRLKNARRGALVGGAASLLQIPGISGLAQGGLGGAASGGAIGALAGAATAAVIGLGVALTAYGAKAATAAAETQKLQIALLSVTQDGFEEARNRIEELGETFQLPITEVTADFTKLTAATKANGTSIEETANVYKGLAAANLALGGNSEKLKGILLATTQVFSKGKVQAEELRGQIGERLPGAFALFAKSMGITTKQLDKALEQGKVTTEDFVKFAIGLYDEYGDAAEKIVNGPENAGERLKKALSDLQISVGTLLVPIGAAFQDVFTDIANAITKATDKLIDFFGVGLEGRVGQLTQQFEAAYQQAQQSTAANRYTPQAERDANVERLRGELQRAQKELRDYRSGFQKTLTDPIDGGGDTAAGKALEDMQKKIRLARIDLEYAEKIKDIEARRDEISILRYERELLIAKYKRDEAKIKENITNEELRQLRIAELRATFDKDADNALKDRAERMKELNTYIMSIMNGTETDFKGEAEKAKEVPEAIQQAFDGANQAGSELYRTFENLIFATENWADTLTSALKALSSILIKFALGGLANGDGQGLFSFLNGTLAPTSNTPAPNYALSNPQNFASAAFPGRASGGGVSGGKPYVVGEQGSELFIPGKSGTIVPSDVFNATRAAMSNSATEGGDSDAFDQNAVAMGSSASITKEKAITREMALAGSTDVNVRYDSTVINNVSYVSEEQFQQGIKAAVAQSKASMFRDLKNKPRARSGIGI